jgi:predicted membrane-bound dolichyl-phosphate-mannose-protein mannosyltransferase
MSNNLIISYDLYKQGQNYDALIAEIKKLGRAWARVNLSVWYVNSTYSTEEAKQKLLAVMDRNDKLFIVDATNNMASIYNLPAEVEKLLRANWAARK